MTENHPIISWKVHTACWCAAVLTGEMLSFHHYPLHPAPFSSHRFLYVCPPHFDDTVLSCAYLFHSPALFSTPLLPETLFWVAPAVKDKRPHLQPSGILFKLQPSLMRLIWVLEEEGNTIGQQPPALLHKLWRIITICNFFKVIALWRQLICTHAHLLLSLANQYPL